MEKEQTVRSSSLQPKRVQFEDSQNRFTESQLKSDFHTQSRFIESQNSGNYLYKFNWIIMFLPIDRTSINYYNKETYISLADC